MPSNQPLYQSGCHRRYRVSMNSEQFLERLHLDRSRALDALPWYIARCPSTLWLKLSKIKVPWTVRSFVGWRYDQFLRTKPSKSTLESQSISGKIWHCSATHRPFAAYTQAYCTMLQQAFLMNLAKEFDPCPEFVIKTRIFQVSLSNISHTVRSKSSIVMTFCKEPVVVVLWS